MFSSLSALVSDNLDLRIGLGRGVLLAENARRPDHDGLWFGPDLPVMAFDGLQEASSESAKVLLASLMQT